MFRRFPYNYIITFYVFCVILSVNNLTYAKSSLMPLAPAYPILNENKTQSQVKELNDKKEQVLKDITIETPDSERKTEISTTDVYSGKVSFDSVLDKAVDNSFDLKISNVDVGISKAVVKQARSAYFPTVKAGLYSEYAHDLTEGTAAMSSVGSIVMNKNTAYQDLFSLNVSYNLYDFGQRGKRLSMAKKDVSSKEFSCNRILRELKLNIIDLYTNALLTYKDLKARQAVYPVYKELFAMKQELYRAGTVSKIDVADDAIKLAQTADEISTLQTRLRMVMRDLTVYTQDKYDMDSLELADFPEQGESYVNNVKLEKEEGQEVYHLSAEKEDAALNINTVDFERTPDYKIYQLEIEKKKSEIEALQRGRLPVIGMYSSYSWYGADKDSMLDSINEFADRNISVGVSASVTPFDGFKINADIKKAKLEMQRLTLERDQKMAELKNKYEKLNEAALYYDGQLENKEELLSKIQDKLAMIERLDKQNLIDKESVLNQKIELIRQKAELEKTIINRISSIKKLNAYAETIE